jgi:ribonuclease D
VSEEQTAPEPEIHLTKDEVNALPLGRYEGPVKVVTTREQLGPAMKWLKGEAVLGFDTETRPCFRKGQSNRPALLQLCGSKGAVLISLRALGLPDAVVALLEDEKVVKAGVAIAFDVRQLQELRPFEPAGFVDVADVAKPLGFKNQGLRGLGAVLLGIRIPKGARTSNWEREDLTEAQVSYAATDAWMSREIYRLLKERGGQAGTAEG